MRIEFKMTSTGIAYLPGLAKPIIIDSKDLSNEEAARLEQLVTAANFAELPRAIGAEPGAADYQKYVITVEHRGHRNTVELTSPVDDPNLQALLDFLRAKVRARSSQKPGSGEKSPS